MPCGLDAPAPYGVAVEEPIPTAGGATGNTPGDPAQTHLAQTHPLQISLIDHERLASRGWQGTSTEHLGDWLLRAGAGFTGRANSVLPLGSPAMGIDDALPAVTAFYRRYQLPPLFQVPLDRPGSEIASLDGDLDQRGWTAFNPTWVLVADLNESLQQCPPRPDLPAAEFDDHPSAAWLGGYLYRGSRLPASAVQLLENAENVVFGSMADHHGQLAVARGVLTDCWLGVTALTVDQSRRRGGVGRHLMAELTRWAAQRGAHSAYLQVAAENDAALRLYDTLGYVRHHQYHYRRAPQP
jgi:GNAT superfamily N-acetyltransferase